MGATTSLPNVRLALVSISTASPPHLPSHPCEDLTATRATCHTATCLSSPLASPPRHSPHSAFHPPLASPLASPVLHSLLVTRSPHPSSHPRFTPRPFPLESNPCLIPSLLPLASSSCLSYLFHLFASPCRLPLRFILLLHILDSLSCFSFRLSFCPLSSTFPSRFTALPHPFSSTLSLAPSLPSHVSPVYLSRFTLLSLLRPLFC